MDGVDVSKGKVGIVMKHTPTEFHVQFGGVEPLSKFKSEGKSKKGKDRFAPAMALTVHKSQGKTLSRNVVINPSRLFERNHLYVALTRATGFDHIYLTEPLTLDNLVRSVYVIGHSQIGVNSPLSRMVTRYAHEQTEETILSLPFLEKMRETQLNKCCYCEVPMVDTYGYDDFITLERIDDNKKHTIDNVRLACSSCNSSHRKELPNPIIPLSGVQIHEPEDQPELYIDHDQLLNLTSR